MKRILFSLLAILITHFAYSQNVGIGTATPNARAALDINSTTKGLLIPSMTTLQRFAIASPPNGLMVYDTERNSFYHYNGTTWSALLNGDYWIRPSASRNRISNPNDSVGIGTNSPTEWLDVDGNIRSRNNINADNDVRATGNVIGGNFVTTGNLVASGNSILSGDVTTSSDLIINNAAATLQLRSSGDNKGFYQLSGNNVRLGTNSGNSTGNLIVRMNGNDRITINSSGDLNTEGKITSTATGSASIIPHCFGRIGIDGTIENAGTGNFTVNKVGTGQYEVTCSGMSAKAIIIVTPEDFRNVIGPYQLSTSVVKFYCTDFNTNTYEDRSFSFIIYK
jgi:hypothetical protein